MLYKKIYFVLYNPQTNKYLRSILGFSGSKSFVMRILAASNPEDATQFEQAKKARKFRDDPRNKVPKEYIPVKYIISVVLE